MILAPLDIAIVAAFCALIFGIGAWFSRKGGESVAQYFVSGRSLPWWLAGTSMVATSFGADTPLFVTGIMRGRGGIIANWYWWSFLLGHVLAVFVFARLWRRAEVHTHVELTERRFSGRGASALRLAKSFYFALPINLGVIVWCNLAMQKILEATLGISKGWAISACLLFSVAYCLLSGLWGVVATDLIQFAVALAGAVALAVVAVDRVGGIERLKESLASLYGADHGLLAFTPGPAGPDGSLWNPVVTTFAVFCGVIWWSSRNADGGGALIQRMLACKDERHAVGATLWFTVAHYAVRTWPWVLTALASLVLFPIGGGAAPGAPELGPYADRGARDPAFAYPALIALLPVGLKGLLLASLFAAFTSTVDSFLNLSASYMTNDVYRRFVRPDAPERHYVFATRLFLLGLMVAAAVITHFVSSINRVFDFLLAFSAGVGLVYMLRWFWWRVNAWSEIAAMATCGTIVTGLAAVEAFAPGLFARYEALRTALRFEATPFRLLVATAATSVVTIVVTLVTRPTERQRLLDFYLKVRPPGFWGPIASEAARFQARPPARHALATAMAVVGATALVLGVTLGAGKWLLGFGSEALTLGGVAAGGALLVVLGLRRAGGAGALVR